MRKMVIALDVGDAWTGIAKADPSLILAKPYDTVATENVVNMLHALSAKQPITRLIVGKPITLRGTDSEQTRRVIAFVQILQQNFPDLKIILWDERLSSKNAAVLQKGHDKEQKRKSHSIAAAFILQTYLDFLANNPE